MYTKQRWDASRAETIEFILDLFDGALAGTYGDELWPRENPFFIGLMRIRNKYARELNTWNDQQIRLGEDSEEEDDDDDDDESSEDEDDDEDEDEDEDEDDD